MNQQKTDSPIKHSDQFLKVVDKVNEDLDRVTVNPFVNSSLFMNTIRGTLEKYGILLPHNDCMPQIELEGEKLYGLGYGYSLYIVHNLDPDGNIEGYATIADEDELDELLGMEDEDEECENCGSTDCDCDEYSDDSVQRRWTPPARKDDDSGNSSEY